MDTSRIDDMIATALAVEAKEGHLANYLQDRAHASGVELEEPQRREAIELFEGYVRSVPELLAAAHLSSQGSPVEDSMGQVIRATVAYWDEPDDLVPDALGLLGLLDNAYFSLRMLQLVSERLLVESGQALVEDDLSALDAVVRDMLGDMSEAIDELVELAMTSAPVDELIAKVGEFSGSFALKSAQTSFTGMSIDALVEDRLAFTAGSDEDPLREELIAAMESVSSSFVKGASPERIAAGCLVIARVLGEAQAEEPIPREDIDAVGALLVGALVVRAGAGEQGEQDREYIERCVDLVLEGL